AIRTRDVKVAWADVVWFTYCIPRHAFNLWLIMKRRLKTQDTLMSWDLASTLVASTCPLCESQPDSHDQLFFDCSYSNQAWKHVTDLAGLSQKHYNIYDVVSSILLIAKRRTSDIVIIKLVIAASPYFLWQERNERLFKNNKRSMV
ncbi:reverse transcriptase domain, reverse transcriptase zinc-binding domain protein, partial [Tanacetum coccineum]